MRHETVIEADLTAVAPARRWTRARVEDAGVHPALTELIVLLTSEVVTNAVSHSAPPVVLYLDVSPGRTRVEVRDSTVAAPVVKHARPTETGGRGVMFVDVLSSARGVEPDVRGTKTVWFEVEHDLHLNGFVEAAARSL